MKNTEVPRSKDAKSLAAAVEDLGYPFLEKTVDLFTLDTKVITEESAVSRMRHIESLGKERCETFISERLLEKKPLSDTITKNKLSFFTTPSKMSSKVTQQLSSIKETALISCQTGGKEFFRHENQGCPPSLSDQVKLLEVGADGIFSNAHCATKSDAKKLKRRHHRWGSSGKHGQT